LQDCWTTREAEASEGAFTEADVGWISGSGDQEGSEKCSEVGIVADNEEILGVGAVLEEFLEIFVGGGGGEPVGLEYFGFVAGLGADKRRGLEAALEGAGNDEVKLDVEGVEDVGELKAVALAFLVEGTLAVEERVGAARSGASVAKDE
jgi:hypothetical protein